MCYDIGRCFAVDFSLGGMAVAEHPVVHFGLAEVNVLAHWLVEWNLAFRCQLVQLVLGIPRVGHALPEREHVFHACKQALYLVEPLVNRLEFIVCHIASVWIVHDKVAAHPKKMKNAIDAIVAMIAS